MFSVLKMLQEATDRAESFYELRGHYPTFTTTVEEEYDHQKLFADLAFDKLRIAANEGKSYCYMSTIERRHQGDPELFDPLKFPPSSRMWPYEQMLAGLKGRPKAIAEWALKERLTVSICYAKKFDPVRKVNMDEFELVVSWPKLESNANAA